MLEDEEGVKMKKILIYVWEWIKKNKWYLFLLVLSTIYLSYYRFDVYQLKEINVRNLIFLIWLILLLLPLFSEMEFMGLKIKKTIEKANKEIKDDIKSLESQIIEIKVATSIANNIHIDNTNTTLPTEDKLEKLLQMVSTIQEKSSKEFEQNIDKLPKNKAVYLFEVRLYIETTIKEIFDSLELNKRIYSLPHMVDVLSEYKLLERSTSILIFQVIKIANRGVHGEIVDDEYIRFVQKVYPKIKNELEELLKSDR